MVGWDGWGGTAGATFVWLVALHDVGFMCGPKGRSLFGWWAGHRVLERSGWGRRTECWLSSVGLIEAIHRLRLKQHGYNTFARVAIQSKCTTVWIVQHTWPAMGGALNATLTTLPLMRRIRVREALSLPLAADLL